MSVSASTAYSSWARRDFKIFFAIKNPWADVPSFLDFVACGYQTFPLADGLNMGGRYEMRRAIRVSHHRLTLLVALVRALHGLE